MTERGTMKDLNVLVADCKDILDDLGITYGPIESVRVNNRLTACWGRCKHNKRTGTYSIPMQAFFTKKRRDILQCLFGFF